MNDAQGLGIRKASAFLASLTVVGALVGFAYDSLVVVAIGLGKVTDAYFLALGVISFVPTLFYLTATNVITPVLASSDQISPETRNAARLWWVGFSVALGISVALFRTPLSVILSNDESVQLQLKQCLLVLAGVPLWSALSEFRRAQLLSVGTYQATGLYGLARNLGMGVAALWLRPRTAAGLGACVEIGYIVQTIVVQLFRHADFAPEGRSASTLDLRRTLVRGLISQGAIFGVAYIPTLVERGVAARLGPGLPTIFSYSYRIVSMLGSVAITSATIPAVAQLARDLVERGGSTLSSTLRHVFDAATRLAVPAALVLCAVALPAGRYMAPKQSNEFALILGLYGLSLVGWTYLRPWVTLEFARGASRAVLLVTAGQALGAIVVSMGGLALGSAVLALGPLCGATVAVLLARSLARVEDRPSLRAGIALRPAWLLGWLFAASCGAIGGGAVMVWRIDRTGALVANLMAVALTGCVAWLLSLEKGHAILHQEEPSASSTPGAMP